MEQNADSVSAVQCPDCLGYGTHGGPSGYYDQPGKGKPCGTCHGQKYVILPDENAQIDGSAS